MQGDSKLSICTMVLYVTPRDTQNKTVKCALTYALTEGKYQTGTWVQTYTDRSAMQTVSSIGARVFICYLDGQTELLAILTEKHCSNYGAEVQALQTAASVTETASSNNHQIAFLSYYLSVLETFSTNKESQPYTISTTRRAVLQWVPAHCRALRNEAADQPAETGSSDSQQHNVLISRENCTIIKSVCKKNDYHHLSK